MILSVSDSSQSKGGQIPLISLDLYKQSIPLKDEGRCSFPLPARSYFTRHISASPAECRLVRGLLEVKRERRNVLSVKVPAVHTSVRAPEKICLQFRNVLWQTSPCEGIVFVRSIHLSPTS